MQKTYADTDAFSVVLSYVQQYDASVKSFLESNAPTIPSFNQFEPTGAPCGGGIPDAYLFDYEGKLVAHGHPAELYGLVPALVEAVPAPVPRPFLVGFEAPQLVSELEALRDPNRSAAPVLAALGGLAKVDDAKGREARRLVGAVGEWMATEVERMERVQNRVPAQTAYHAQCFTARFEGAEASLDARVTVLSRTLTKLPGVREYLRGCDDLERGAAATDEKLADQFVKRGVATLERVVGNSKASTEVREAAREKIAEQGG